jgi:glutathione S-transferase
MAEHKLYCFAQSGNAYRAALMLNLIGADWEPIYVDFFVSGETRTPKYRAEVNEMGEVPVLVHGDKKLTQSAVILTYLARRSGKFLPQGEDEEFEALRWIIFDNQKVNGFLGPYRFLKNFAKPAGDPAVIAFFKGRIDGTSRPSTSGSKAENSCSASGPPSQTCRLPAISTIPLRNSVSTSARTMRQSAPGASA